MHSCRTASRLVVSSTSGSLVVSAVGLEAYSNLLFLFLFLTYHIITTVIELFSVEDVSFSS